MHDRKKQLGDANIKDSILNSLDIGICVTDMVTNKILFANMKLQKIHGGKTLTGKICWEALSNITKRCEFCPIPYLLKNPGKHFQWELCIEDKLFQMNDSIIPWTNGKVVHLQYMVDITNSLSVAKKIVKGVGNNGSANLI